MHNAYRTLVLGSTMASLLLLTACSGSSSPSSSEAKQAIQKSLGDCSIATISSFDKVNGIADGDNRYTLQVKYALEFAPLPENAKLLDDMNAQLTSHTDWVQWEKNEFIVKVRERIMANLHRTCPNMPRNVYGDYSQANITSYSSTIHIDYTYDNLRMVKSDNGWVGI
ncbi:hypothetical protein DBR44_05540 [Aquitalea sp. FJL05]|uniref:hypothetical protein n=1 Tax=Aquitalea sp. FJL05 TaxID=2153366 RepID=UPI000F5A5816|nr:hypothetical protein [Aquitalea sp. FJL05]RQO76150.1 hypothetical protein DBR44_05540 [Aquitalea sp. FJL05]